MWLGMRSRRWLRAVISAGVVTAVLVLAGSPAWASTVRIQDDARVLDTTTVQNDAASLPVGLFVWTTTQDAANSSTFDNDVRTTVSSAFPVVIGINTRSHHESVQIGAKAGLSRSAALSAEQAANSAFVSAISGRHDYTGAVTAAVSRLKDSFGSGGSTGGGFPVWLVVVIVTVVVIAVLFLLRRLLRRRGPDSAPVPQPQRLSYGAAQYDPGYGPGYLGPVGQPGISPGAAGVVGAVGGGALGYELGRMEGAREQYREDRAAESRYLDDSGQGDWVVGLDSDFGGEDPGDRNGSGSGGSGSDW